MNTLRIFEVIIYSMVNFLPFALLSLYHFKNMFRFGKAKTILLFSGLSVIQVIMGFTATFNSGGLTAVVTTVGYIIYFLFYIIAVKAHPGKILFVLLAYSNIGNLTVMSGKCLENMLFPAYAMQRNRWTFSLCNIIVDFIILIPMFIYARKNFTPIIQDKKYKSSWKYIWLIPGTFHVTWYYLLYLVPLTPTEIAINPINVLFLLAINLGAILVYHIVANFMITQTKISVLKEEANTYKLQQLQYKNIEAKIMDARRAKHNLRHQAIIMSAYLEDGKLDELKAYLEKYAHRFDSEKSVIYTTNYTVNSIISYYSYIAEYNNIDFDAVIDVPDFLNIPSEKLSIMLGNILENSTDACSDALKQTGDESNKPFINIHMKTKSNMLFLNVDNSYVNKPDTDSNGSLISTKHAGLGIGIDSVKEIVNENGGIFELSFDSGICRTSVIMALQD